MAALHAIVGEFSWYAERFSPYPLLVEPAELQMFVHLRATLNRAIVEIVDAYGDDPRIADIIRLPPPLTSLLGKLRHKPYEVGSFLPDLLLDHAGTWKVCEINARFPVNGYLSSYYINSFIGGLDYLSGSAARPLTELDGLLEAIAGRFEPDKPLLVLRDREKGMDTHLLLPELQRYGIRALTVRGGAIYDGGEPVQQFILELERDELLAMSAELLEALADSPAYFNDLRTLLLAHDKRLLAVLGNAGIMADYLDKADLAVLAEHILPTYQAYDPKIAEDLQANPGGWVLKRNSSGRGIDMLFGWECEPSQWRQTLATQADDYTAQRCLPQRRVPIIVLENGELRQQPMNIVAMLPGFDGRLFGPGFFRAGLDSVINVSGGRGAIVPAMTLI
ncbi:MAG: hypothetical protein ACXWF8_12160 [Methylobacter sp.]